MQYTIQKLLDLRSAGTKQADLKLDLVDEIDLRVPVQKAVDGDAVLRFRKNPDANAGEIKFVEDMDVRACQIVHAYNLSDGVTWPILKCFCEKTVGVPALDLRMMRRRKPAEARIIFRTEEEARRFISKAPPSVALKGRVPRFEMEAFAPKTRRPADVDMMIQSVTTTPCDVHTSAAEAVEVAHVAEAADVCCAKTTNGMELTVVPTVLAAVALEAHDKRGPRTAAKSTASKVKAVAKAPKTKRPQATVVAISLDELQREADADEARWGL